MRRADRAAHELLVGMREQPAERGELDAALVETRHAQRQHVFGLIAVHACRAARFGAHRDPPGGVPIERLLGAVDRVVDERPAECAKRGLERDARRYVPHARELRCRVGAWLVASAAVQCERHRRWRPHDRARPQPATSAAAAACAVGSAPSATSSIVQRRKRAVGSARSRAGRRAHHAGTLVLSGGGSAGTRAARHPWRRTVAPGTTPRTARRRTRTGRSACRRARRGNLGRHVRRRAEHRAGRGESLRQRAPRLDVRVRRARGRARRCSRRSRASPKSVTRTRPSRPTRTLSGLKSRCTSPAACAAASPRRRAHDRQHLAPRALRVLSQRAASRLRRAPSRRTRVAGSVPTSWTATTFGCASRAIACASRTSHVWPPLRGRGGPEQLDRDLAVELGIVRRVDDPHAAGAEHSDDDVPADQRAGREPLVARALHALARALPFALGRAGRIGADVIASIALRGGCVVARLPRVALGHFSQYRTSRRVPDENRDRRGSPSRAAR